MTIFLMERDMVIKNLRLQNAWSQEQLADITGLSTRTIQRIEKNDSASIESIKVLAQAFNLEIQELQERLTNQNIESTEEAKKDTSIIVFVVIMSMLFVINFITNPDYLWAFFPLLGWGIPLLYKRYKKKLRRE